MATSKKRVIKSLESLTDDLRDLMKEQYPSGYQGSVTRISAPKKEPIFVFPLEAADAVYLVKVPVTKNSDGGYDMESTKKQEFDNSEEDDGIKPGDDIEGDSEDVSDGDSMDDDGGGSKEASYDPDFDN